MTHQSVPPILSQCKIIHTESSYITNKATRRCDAAASAQNTQRWRDVLRIPEFTERTKDEKRLQEQNSL